jgi:hypothetical protein
LSAKNDCRAPANSLYTPKSASANSALKLPSLPIQVPKGPKKAPSIALSEPYPLLDPGCYEAVCTEADFAWARQWKKWMARLTLEPQNYEGRPYTGHLCKFLGLGKNPEQPYAGPQSDFRRLYVEVNGSQPESLHAGMEIFVGIHYDIEVVTVQQDRNGKPRSSEHWYSIVRAIHPCRGRGPTLQPSNTRPIDPLTLRTQTTPTTDQHSNTGTHPWQKGEKREFG